MDILSACIFVHHATEAKRGDRSPEIEVKNDCELLGEF